MLIIFNLRGLGCLILAIALSLAPGLWFPELSLNAGLTLGGPLIFLDLLHRYFVVRPEIAKELVASGDERPILKRPTSLVWFLSGRGASVMFLPMWIWGVILIMLLKWAANVDAA